MDIDELNQLVAELGVKGWCKPAERRLLYHLARYGPGEGAIVEIGSWKGLSTLYLAAGSKAAARERVTAIDRFPYSTMTALHSNLLLAKVQDWVTPIAAESHEAAQSWPGTAIRLLFIDGDHTYEGVRQDYAAWQHLVAPGGVIAFHDALEPNWPDVSRFLDEVLPSKEWTAYTIVAPASSAMATASDPVANTIVVAQRHGPHTTPVTVPDAHGAFTTIQQLLGRLRGTHGDEGAAVAASDQQESAQPLAGQAIYDYATDIEAQFHAAEEYALELEERHEQILAAHAKLQADYAQLAATTQRLDHALRAANPLKRRLHQLRRIIRPVTH